MSIGEKHTALCQSVEVWCPRLRMSSKTTDPIVQVIDRNEQHIRPRCVFRLQQVRQGDRNQADP